jgi:hypothetical protein
LKCSFIMNTTHDCTCNRLFFVITMLRNLNMHIDIYLCRWSFAILYDFWLPFWYLQTFLNLKTCTYVFMAIFYQGRKYSHWLIQNPSRFVFKSIFYFRGWHTVHFIYRIYEHASCFAYYLIPTFRLVYIGVIFFSHELIITCIFIYVRVRRMNDCRYNHM